MDNQMERRWLSLFVENRAGVLARFPDYSLEKLQYTQSYSWRNRRSNNVSYDDLY